MNKKNKTIKLIYATNYGCGIYTCGYKKLAIYPKLIQWLEKYEVNNITDILKKIIKKEINLDKIEEIILKININNLKSKKEKELIEILQYYLKNIDHIIFPIINTDLEIEEICPNEIIYIGSYDGLEYIPSENTNSLSYHEIKELINKTYKKFYIIKLSNNKIKLIQTDNIDKIKEKYNNIKEIKEINDNEIEEL